ncbi:purine-cytosine permease family protein [Planotetraspora mira]|uniref:Cytosine permease n=1 Tax=Planotetraspora mira TaxID=58121 RepID=A0A8J3TXQ6_9ACTN|nr:cytosine permease [Planotetraspora mira]GII33252.1 cytosine permease [Planotetraspora mira]
MSTTGPAVREGEYGDRVAAVEPGGLEFIPLKERHGRPLDLLWTWMSPNLEFATVFLGVLAVAAFGLSFWQAALAAVVGTGLGALAHGVLSARGPSAGVPQMVLGRVPFGFWGNLLPSAFNTVAAGIGWFAVNSVSGALALNTLTGLPGWACLVIVVAVMVALGFFGHNLVQAFERYAFPVLALIFLIAAAVILGKADLGYAGTGGGTGGFLLAVGATFGYAAGWNPYAADYTRYLPPGSSRRAVGLSAGLGVFVSCVVLEVVGAASATIGGDALGQPTTAFTGHLPGLVANLTLLAIALGAISANALNVYSGAMSLLALGVRLPLTLRRAIVALACGVAGFLVALSGLEDAGHKYEAFLLIIAYWIGPWLGVVLADRYLRRDRDIERLLFDSRHVNWAGPIAMVAGVVLSVWLFSNQERYVGLVPARVPEVGDIAFEVGFVISAVVYAALRPLRR